VSQGNSSNIGAGRENVFDWFRTKKQLGERGTRTNSFFGLICLYVDNSKFGPPQQHVRPTLTPKFQTSIRASPRNGGRANVTPPRKTVQIVSHGNSPEIGWNEDVFNWFICQLVDNSKFGPPQQCLRHSPIPELNSFLFRLPRDLNRQLYQSSPL